MHMPMVVSGVELAGQDPDPRDQIIDRRRAKVVKRGVEGNTGGVRRNREGFAAIKS